MISEQKRPRIRRALDKDIPQIISLLGQVLEIHAKIRPDIFNSGYTKYSSKELQIMIKDDMNPIYVVVEEDKVLAYAFCQSRLPHFTHIMKPVKMFHIDDFCVDEACRQQHVGETLFNYLKEEAKRLGYEEITLNSWVGNEAANAFYKKMGLKVRSSVLEYKF